MNYGDLDETEKIPLKEYIKMLDSTDPNVKVRPLTQNQALWRLALYIVILLVFAWVGLQLIAPYILYTAAVVEAAPVAVGLAIFFVIIICIVQKF